MPKKKIFKRIGAHLKRNRPQYLIVGAPVAMMGAAFAAQGRRRRKHAGQVAKYTKRTGGTKKDAKKLFRKSWKKSGHGQLPFEAPKRRKKRRR